MHIGPYQLKNRLIAAPMAGVTDRPFRMLCKRLGAGHAVSEMITSNAMLYGSDKTRRRANFEGELAPVAVQIAGSAPQQMAEAARHNVAAGAQIIDINMGCPAKKVCNVLAGSALLQDEDRVARILDAVVQAVEVPVTLKTRLGFRNGEENILRIAKLAERSGIVALALHGRTREDMYKGAARYELIAEVKRNVKIPVVANGDITTPEKAKQVLDATGADAIMVGRAAQGRPWIFREIDHFLQTGEKLPEPRVAEIHSILMEHLQDHYTFHGEYSGCRIARKHIAWYTNGLVGSNMFRQAMYQLDSTAAQLAAVDNYFKQLAQVSERLVYQDTPELTTA
ncbi:tRNA dihydrouridine synthase DusB [Chitinimonas sp. BJB300]|uniref:tRNA dihydrouridine synthase DusB n=1 Tax=Chitinimonas sp. BJB300 TaxID=1559339 RepID=UPI000C0E00CB|nr:tRNA dihydrouridine synthase DusB [Chitinimonas sp. BJB300]PHV12655.1 tRNA dihydrouridine synthase DusB [Chitinimonas sp. BJB300]TSJ91189.1 tRNA dihydrouridine synthase DusB [Chitinimonas sp. BJB300]